MSTKSNAIEIHVENSDSEMKAPSQSKDKKSIPRLGEHDPTVEELLDIYKRQLTEGIEPTRIPIRIYVSSDEISVLDTARERLLELVDWYSYKPGFPQKGSWFQEIALKLARATETKEAKRRLKKVESALELQALGKAQAGIDKEKSAAAASLIGSLEGTDEAVIQIGSLVIVKRNNENGKSAVAVLSLTHDQMIAIEENPSMLRDPTEFLDSLSESIESQNLSSTAQIG